MGRESSRDQDRRESGEALRFIVEETVQVTAQHLASPWLPDLLTQKFLWHSLFVRTVKAATEIAERDIWPEVFNTYLILGSRWFSHHESVEALVTHARYGDCMALLRSLLEDTDLMTYFSCYPDQASDWKERLSRAPDWSDEVYKKGIRKFGMRRIWDMLKTNGIEPLGERGYAVLSSTVHASPWGARFYGHTVPGDLDHFYLSLEPIYDRTAAFSALLMLQETYPKPIQAFLRLCDASTAPKAQWRSIKADYYSFIEGWQAKMKFDSWLQVAMADAEERLSRGEDPEAVQADLAKRFQEIYGEPADPPNDATSSG